ncbi:hypothetical protein B4U79_11004 [Dinothrombium tinctorium]|uniref:Centrosomal protein of 83 kDa-like protein n=1 Tax=Dinothrombium tinctorium TaxID=1965070 RepID=A0A3S3P0C6_9ACAR|nr:hypothetical protein B4U79_01448 [Dinothrombium tinctorium]RWS05332.1 hypothetical protein B4U79_00896 [Dinothrombium tinctorium]RWS05344.1 hypothetical protein B4U79_11004 [Dinothrombium tinctorium]
MYEQEASGDRDSPVFVAQSTDFYNSNRMIGSKEQELQKLLAEERQRSEQRKANYQALKAEHIKLQQDFLSLQNEMKHILEETKLIKDQKELELNAIKQTFDEKEKLIHSLRKELEAREPSVIREKFTQELKEPLVNLEKEKNNLIREKEKLTFEIKMHKQKIEHLEKELVDASERAKLAYEAEINLVRREKEELRLKYLEMCQTPDNQRLIVLSEENTKLKSKLKSFQRTLEEAENQYKKIESKLELILNQHEKSEESHENEVKMLRMTIERLREENIGFDSLLKVNRKENEELSKELKRCEKEVEKLKKEIDEKEKNFEKEKENLKRLILKEKLNFEEERESFNEESKKLKKEIELKAETIAKMEQLAAIREKETQVQINSIKQQEWEKTIAVERDKATLEVRLKEANEDKTKLKDEIEQMKRQIETAMELRLSIEKDSLVLRAKVDALQSNQEELEKLRRQHSILQEEMSKLRGEHSEATAINRELVRQKDRYKEEYNRLKHELDEERKTLSEFRIMSENNLKRLRDCLDEERNEMREKLISLQEEVKQKKKEREEMKGKCKEYAAICEKLQIKLKEVKRTEEERMKESIPLETHNNLKKQYKELKKKQNQLSEMLNCSFDATHCIPVTNNEYRN